MEGFENTPNHGTKVPFDPGWNDPPKINTQQSTPNRPRNFLNKRVAFPLSGTSASPAPPNAQMPPLPTAFMPPLIPPVQSMPLNTTSEEVPVNSECLLKEVKEILLEFLDNSSELGPKSNDIKRRISVMEEMWVTGKLNNAIMLRMKELACALRDDQPTAADDIHRALMIDHVSAVGTWMPGVKHLVHHCIARSELLALDKES
ncbi:unnamed protein product [Plutella xylostella]|uniref:(diamondback moth) hypothetical protein n=1 Tax=Plutella xylostella TaxID=51655 RepID=A0A8S4DW29_PLUXY|nr:steroid receptor RNA activator 1 [Plutella xylostella]CAG9107366.1 unnamed protein product [Plutella xylostella]